MRRLCVCGAGACLGVAGFLTASRVRIRERAADHGVRPCGPLHELTFAEEFRFSKRQDARALSCISCMYRKQLRSLLTRSTGGALRLERGVAMSIDEPRQLDDEQIEEVAGGYIHIAMVGEHAGEWEVIDDNTGEVLGRYERVRGRRGGIQARNECEEDLDGAAQEAPKRIALAPACGCAQVAAYARPDQTKPVLAATPPCPRLAARPQLRSSRRASRYRA